MVQGYFGAQSYGALISRPGVGPTLGVGPGSVSFGDHCGRVGGGPEAQARFSWGLAGGPLQVPDVKVPNVKVLSSNTGAPTRPNISRVEPSSGVPSMDETVRLESRRARPTLRLRPEREVQCFGS